MYDTGKYFIVLAVAFGLVVFVSGMAYVIGAEERSISKKVLRIRGLICITSFILCVGCVLAAV